MLVLSQHRELWKGHGQLSPQAAREMAEKTTELTSLLNSYASGEIDEFDLVYFFLQRKDSPSRPSKDEIISKYDSSAKRLRRKEQRRCRWKRNIESLWGKFKVIFKKWWVDGIVLLVVSQCVSQC